MAFEPYWVALQSAGAAGRYDDYSQPCIAALYQYDGTPWGGASVEWFAESTSGGAFGTGGDLGGGTDGNGQVSSGLLTANGNPGQWRLWCNSPDVPLAGEASFDLTVNADPLVATTITIVSGNNQSQTGTMAFAQGLTVLVMDQNHNPLVGAAIYFNSPASGPSCSWGGTTVYGGVTNSTGNVTAPAPIAGTVEGTYSVVVSPASGSPATPFTLTNLSTIPAVVTTITLHGDKQSAAINGAFPQAVGCTVYDQFARPMVGLAVSITCPASGSSGTFPGAALVASGVTDASGKYMAPTLTANATAGPWNAAVDAGASQVSLSLNNATGVPVATSVIVYGGDHQRTPINTAFPTALSVQVLDQFGYGIAGVPVTFAAAGSPGCTFATNPASSGSDGVASTNATANATGGTYNPTATIP